MSRKTAIACFIAVIVLVGCALFALDNFSDLLDKIGATHTDSSQVIIAENTAEIAEAIRESIGMDDYASLDDEQVLTHFGFDSDVIADSTVYTSTKQNNADEIAVFRLADMNKSDEAMVAISDRLSLKLKTFDVLNSYEYDKVENAIFLNKGEYIILVTTSKTGSAWSAIESFYQQETAAKN